MVLDAPDSLQVVSLEDAKVVKKDRVVVSVWLIVSWCRRFFEGVCNA